MMIIAGITFVLEGPDRLHPTRRYFDVSALGDSVHFATHVNGIADVLQGVRAHDEVHGLVVERQWLGADVDLQPRLAFESLGACTNSAENPPRVIRHEVDDVIGPRERLRPPSDVDHDIGGFQRLQCVRCVCG